MQAQARAADGACETQRRCVRPEERVLALYVRWRAAGVEERMQTEEVLGRYAAFCDPFLMGKVVWWTRRWRGRRTS
jgi:hypothetical protein